MPITRWIVEQGGSQHGQSDYRARRHRLQARRTRSCRGLPGPPSRGRAKRWCGFWPAVSAIPTSPLRTAYSGPTISRSCSGMRGGIVEAVGEGVTKLQEGDYVILAWRAPCGACRFCLVGKPHLCAASLNAEKRCARWTASCSTRSSGIGTFCTHTLVHASQASRSTTALPPAQMSSDRLRRDDRRRRGALHSRRQAGTVASRSSAAAASAISVIAGRASWPARRRSSRSMSTRASWSGRRSSARPTRSTRARATRSRRSRR